MKKKNIFKLFFFFFQMWHFSNDYALPLCTLRLLLTITRNWGSAQKAFKSFFSFSDHSAKKKTD